MTTWNLILNIPAVKIDSKHILSKMYKRITVCNLLTYQKMTAKIAAISAAELPNVKLLAVRPVPSLIF